MDIVIIFPLLELGWQCSYGSGYHWLQNEALRAGPRHLAIHLKRLFQCLVDHSFPQTHERFPQV